MQSRLLLCSLAMLFFHLSLDEPAFSEKITESDTMSHTVNIFMCGDVMTGRGIDQVLPHPGDPVIHEPYMKSAAGYVELAEEVNGPIPKPVSPSYIWGDTVNELKRMSADVRIINLETSITRSDDYRKDKAIHYRMHPKNIDSITAAGIDVASLANNHILDWGYSGLRETMETLKRAGVKTAGSGQNLQEAEAPAVIPIKGKGRVILFSYGSMTSGVPLNWAASEDMPGINLLQDLSDRSIQHIKDKIRKVRQKGDIVLISLHWGSNWGYDIPPEQREFAHKLIDDAGVDIIHGHSSHHVRGIEVYRGRLILYGCGDFLNDYEGISGYEMYRDDLGLMYFANVDASTGKLVSLQMTPTQVRNFRVNRASGPDVLWLKDTLNREGRKFGTGVKLNKDNTFTLYWE